MKVILGLAFASAIACVIPTPVRAEWVYVTSDDDTQTYIQQESIIQKGSQVFYLKRDDFAFPDDDGVTTTIARRAVDCATRERFSYGITGFDNSGRIVYQEDGAKAIAPPASPGSRGADIAAFVCRQ